MRLAMPNNHRDQEPRLDYIQWAKNQHPDPSHDTA